MGNYIFLKFGLILITLIVFQISHAQITGGEMVDKKKDGKDKKEKSERLPKVDTFNRDSLSGTVYHVSGFMQYSYRVFEDQSVYGVHADKVNEVPMYSTGGINLGILMPISAHWSVDAGVTFFGHGEAYNYSAPDSDSTFNYTNVYMQVGVPLSLRYTYGDDFQFFGFAGITPINILSRRYDVNYRVADGEPFDLPLASIKDDFTQINVMATAGIGVNYYFKTMGMFLSTEYRRHLGNTYSEDTFKRTHNMFGIGLRFGLNFRI